MPKDLERACKIGEDFLQSRFGLLGIATPAPAGLNYAGTGTYQSTPPSWDQYAGPGVSVDGGSGYIPGVQPAP